MTCTQIHEEREGKKEVISCHTKPNNNTQSLHGGKGHREEFNDAAETPKQPSDSAVGTARSRQSD